MRKMSARPTTIVMIMQTVEISSKSCPSKRPSTSSSSRNTMIEQDAGSERESTLARKLPLTRSLFGSRASTNDGMPMTVVEMSDI